MDFSVYIVYIKMLLWSFLSNPCLSVTSQSICPFVGLPSLSDHYITLLHPAQRHKESNESELKRFGCKVFIERPWVIWWLWFFKLGMEAQTGWRSPPHSLFHRTTCCERRKGDKKDWRDWVKHCRKECWWIFWLYCSSSSPMLTHWLIEISVGCGPPAALTTRGH